VNATVSTPASSSYLPISEELADDSAESILELLESRGLGDGLPVIPPTPNRVEAMLEYSTGDPDEVLFTLQPRSGVVTRRVVAINAVLAGCPPKTFPVVLTALRALAQPEINLRGVNATTHPVAPLILVHGEVVAEAGFSGGVGCFGPGNRANATVGRAVRLTMLHVAESPWGSYARSRGVDAPSAVTVHCGEGPHNVHDAEAAGNPALILDKIASAMTSLGMNNAPISQAEIFIVLGPEHAASLALGALSRKDVSSYLFDHARLPASVLRRHFEERAWTQWMKIVADDHQLPMTAEPDNIRVVVAGGPGKHSLVIPSWGMTRSVTLPIQG
jgi:hypothetical protein